MNGVKQKDQEMQRLKAARSWKSGIEKANVAVP